MYIILLKCDLYCIATSGLFRASDTLFSIKLQTPKKSIELVFVQTDNKVRGWKAHSILIYLNLPIVSRLIAEVQRF